MQAILAAVCYGKFIALGRGESANGQADFENIFAYISGLKQDFHRFLDPAETVDSSLFWAWILDFVCNKNINIHVYCCPVFRLRLKFQWRIWLINPNGLADLHTPIHPPAISTIQLRLYLSENAHVISSTKQTSYFKVAYFVFLI